MNTLLNIILISALIISSALVNATSYVVDPSHPSPDEIPPVLDYDPFADISGDDIGYADGKIDIRDVSYVAIKFGTSGNSIRNMTVINYPSYLQNNVTIENWPLDEQGNL